MTGDEYLFQILQREAVDTSAMSPVRRVHGLLLPLVSTWANGHLRGVSPSGSFAKGTANRSGTDIDLFISLAETATAPLADIYASLFATLTQHNLKPRKQNVSINVRVAGYDVDLVPARQQNFPSEDHSLFRRRANTWTKTNITKHIIHVQGSGCVPVIRVLKLWRDFYRLDIPSFLIELCVIEALKGVSGSLSHRVLVALRYFRDSFATARIVDPANTNNVVSDDLTAAEKAAVVVAARTACAVQTWSQIVR